MTRRHWITLWLTSATLSLAITAPFFRSRLPVDRRHGQHPAFSPHRFGDRARRRRTPGGPQDWFIALTSQVVDGGIVVKVLTTLALILAGVGYGRLVRVALPGSGSAGMLVGTTVAIWNPYVAERLLQGHWSLLFGYAAIAWIFLCANRVRRHPGYISWSVLAAWLAVAGLTPTGSMLALFTLVAALLVPVCRQLSAAGSRRGPAVSHWRSGWRRHCPGSWRRCWAPAPPQPIRIRWRSSPPAPNPVWVQSVRCSGSAVSGMPTPSPPAAPLSGPRWRPRRCWWSSLRACPRSTDVGAIRWWPGPRGSPWRRLC